MRKLGMIAAAIFLSVTPCFSSPTDYSNVGFDLSEVLPSNQGFPGDQASAFEVIPYGGWSGAIAPGVSLFFDPKSINLCEGFRCGTYTGGSVSVIAPTGFFQGYLQDTGDTDIGDLGTFSTTADGGCNNVVIDEQASADINITSLDGKSGSGEGSWGMSLVANCDPNGNLIGQDFSIFFAVDSFTPTPTSEPSSLLLLGTGLLSLGPSIRRRFIRS